MKGFPHYYTHMSLNYATIGLTLDWTFVNNINLLW